MQPLLMIKYGELGLKGKNKNLFIRQLVQNIEQALAAESALPPRQVRSTRGRIMVPLLADTELPLLRRLLSRVFGIYAICPVQTSTKELPIIQKTALRVLEQTLPEGGEFKVESRRADKSFPFISPEISREVGNYIFDQTGDKFTAQCISRSIFCRLRCATKRPMFTAAAGRALRVCRLAPAAGRW